MCSQEQSSSNFTQVNAPSGFHQSCIASSAGCLKVVLAELQGFLHCNNKYVPAVLSHLCCGGQCVAVNSGIWLH